jgi:glycosyltransferase involved in cell wall biosynthesis
MRLAYLSEWFPPEPEGAPNWIARALRDRGFDVGVVTGVPHYPSGTPAAGYDWRSLRRETIDGFPVLRVPEFPSHDGSAARRIATFGSFALSSASLGARAIGEADVCLVYSSPATAALAAMVARRRFGVPYVLVIQDLWPDSMLFSGFLGEGLARRSLGAASHRFVDATYRGASHIAVISPGMKDALTARGVPEEKVSVVYNWVDEDVLGPRPASGVLRRKVGVPDSDFLMLFAGNQGEAQGLEAWVEAVGLLHDRPDVHLLLMGGGTRTSRLKGLADRIGVIDRVHFLPPVPVEQVSELTADADVGVVSLTDQPLFRITLPSKLQAALAQGKPVLCSVPGDGARIVTAAGAGWTAAPDDPSSIAAAVLQAASTGADGLAARGRAGRDYYLEHMSQEVGSGRLAEILRGAVKGP